MLTLFHAPQSGSSRIIWLLEELGSNHTIEYVNIPRMDGSGASDPANPHPDTGNTESLTQQYSLLKSQKILESLVGSDGLLNTQGQGTSWTRLVLSFPMRAGVGKS
jgi:hypothetical protein